MTTEELTAEFSKVHGQRALAELIACLHEVNSKDPAFAIAACSDAVLAFEALVKGHTNADEKCIEAACGLFAAALFNGFTNYQVDIVYEEGRNLLQ